MKYLLILIFLGNPSNMDWAELDSMRACQDAKTTISLALRGETNYYAFCFPKQ